MATLRNKQKLAALNKENCEEHPRSNLAQKSKVPRSQEDYITQVFEKTEARVTKKLSQEFRRTENRILGALSRFDDSLLNPLFQGHSGTAPETSWNTLRKNQGTNEDDSQSNPQPESSVSQSQTTRNFGADDAYDTNSLAFADNWKLMLLSQPYFLTNDPSSQWSFITVKMARLQTTLSVKTTNNGFPTTCVTQEHIARKSVGRQYAICFLLRSETIGTRLS